MAAPRQARLEASAPRRRRGRSTPRQASWGRVFAERLALAGPVVWVVVLTLLAALPWGMGADTRFFLPLLPIVAIVHWSLVRPDLMPVGVAFLTGLSLDVLTHGPLGFWSLMHVLGHVLAVAVRRRGAGLLVRMLLVAFVTAALTLVAWAIASVYFVSLAAWRPLVTAAGIVLLVYPLLCLLFAPIDGWISKRGSLRLERGG